MKKLPMLLCVLPFLLAGCGTFRVDGRLVDAAVATATARAEKNEEGTAIVVVGEDATPEAHTRVQVGRLSGVPVASSSGDVASESAPATAAPSPTPTAPSVTSTLLPPHSSEGGATLASRNLICLSTHGDVNKAEAADSLRAALEQIQQQHPDWEAAIHAPEGLSIAGECEAALPEQELTKGTGVGPGIVKSPGPWYSVVIVLDDAQADTLLGESDARVVPYEMMSEGDMVWTVTNAVVMRNSALQAQTVLEELSLALQLDPTKLLGRGGDPNDVPGFDVRYIAGACHDVPPPPPLGGGTLELHPGAEPLDNIATVAEEMPARTLPSRGNDEWLAYAVKNEQGEVIATRFATPRAGGPGFPSPLALEAFRASPGVRATIHVPPEPVSQPEGITCYPPEVTEVRGYPALLLRQEPVAGGFPRVLPVTHLIWREGDVYWYLSAISYGEEGYDWGELLTIAREGLSAYQPATDTWEAVTEEAPLTPEEQP